MTDKEFIQQLVNRVERMVLVTENEMYALPFEILNFKEDPEKWSVLECMEHLNLYCRFYLPQFHRTFRIGDDPVAAYSRGWLGEKLIKMIEPSNVKKQRTLRHMNPCNSHLTKTVLDEFTDHQHDLLNLLKNSIGKDLNKRNIPVEFLRLLKMKRGVAFEFIIFHQERHILQAQRAVIGELA